MSQAILSGSVGSVRLNVVSYSSSLELVSQSAQTQKQLVSYAIKARQTSFTIVCQFNSRQSHKEFYSFVRRHHRSVAALQNPVLDFYWPQQRLLYKVIIESVQAGASVEDWFPQVSVKLTTVQDLINSVTKVFSHSTGWEGLVQDSIDPFFIPPMTMGSSSAASTPKSSKGTFSWGGTTFTSSGGKFSSKYSSGGKF